MNWKNEALELAKSGKSWRKVAKQLGVSKSTVSDFLRKVLKQAQPEQAGNFPKILFLDVEVSPSVTVAFSRFKAFASPDHVLKEPYMLTYVVKWAHEDKTIGNTILDTETEDHNDDYHLIKDLWDFIDAADIVVAQNAKFDQGWFNQRCVVHGFNPPSPYKLIDTLQMLKKNFSLPSNSLAAAAQYFNLTRKKSHEGITLWIRCMNGEREAFEEMLDYNDGDVVTLEELYNIVQPWSQHLPNIALYYKDDKIRCCGCGSENVMVTDKTAFTALSEFEVVKCNSCGKHSRMRRNIRSKEQMQNTLTNLM